MAKSSHVYTLTVVNGPKYEDKPDVEFTNVLNLISHVQAAYPDHTSYVMTAVKVR